MLVLNPWSLSPNGYTTKDGRLITIKGEMAYLANVLGNDNNVVQIFTAESRERSQEFYYGTFKERLAKMRWNQCEKRQ